jgi:hypothetical protein
MVWKDIVVIGDYGHKSEYIEIEHRAAECEESISKRHGWIEANRSQSSRTHTKEINDRERIVEGYGTWEN